MNILLINVNIFNFLANTIVQKIFSKIKETKSWKKTSMLPSSKEFGLVKMLLNSNVTEFDSQAIENFCFINEDVSCLRFILEKCPRITKVIVRNDCYCCFDMDYCWNNKSFKSWTNLKHLSFRSVLCNDETMRLIQENCPNLELVICIFYVVQVFNNLISGDWSS
jgi:hypothetical protein